MGSGKAATCKLRNVATVDVLNHEDVSVALRTARISLLQP
jgi:hypothetical protein